MFKREQTANLRGVGLSFFSFRAVRDFSRISGAADKKRYAPYEIEAFNAHGWHCHYCGIIANLTSDHIIPQSLGGDNSVSNIVPACRTCNASKGARPYDDFVEFIQAEKIAYLTFLEGSHI